MLCTTTVITFDIFLLLKLFITVIHKYRVTRFYGSHCNNVKMTRPVTFLKVGLMQFLQHSLQMSTFQRFCTSKYFFLNWVIQKV